MENILRIVEKIENFVWGVPLIVILLAVGIWLTIRLKGIQITKLPHSIKAMFAKESSGSGEVSSFSALCIALSATIGTGNIIGVATAISLGGPGALLWLFIGTVFGLAIKYAEGFLAIRYRHMNEDGSVTGGPFAYIEYGMGEKHKVFAKVLAKIFACIGAIVALFGMGTLAQVNGITDAFDNVFKGVDILSFNILGKDVTIFVIVAGIVITILSVVIIFGGIKRLANVCTLVVPLMAVLYILTCTCILVLNVTSIPNAVVSIFQNAFAPKAAAAGALGITIKMAMQNGIAKGLFSSEAGLGSAPIALATSKSNNPVEQGMSLMGGTIVTLVICLMTGLAVIITNSWMNPDLEGINVTISAFQAGLPLSSLTCAIILLLCIFFFAFTTIIGWNLYGLRCVGYLTSSKKIRTLYQVIYILLVFIAPYLTVKLVWSIADITCAFMMIPNLIAIMYLSNVVTKETNEYFKKK